MDITEKQIKVLKDDLDKIVQRFLRLAYPHENLNNPACRIKSFGHVLAIQVEDGNDVAAISLPGIGVSAQEALNILGLAGSTLIFEMKKKE